jgi:AcrR family transcriptional regulator
MKAAKKSAKERPLGRPRSESARLAILDAAYGLLKKKPVAAISTVEIARKAGVSTATMYRWWPIKEALLLEAFLHRLEFEEVLKPGSDPLANLKQYVLQVGESFTGESGIVAARLLASIQDNAVLRKEFLETVYSPRDKDFRATVKEAIRRGQLPAGTQVEIFLETIFGPLILRLLLRHEKIDRDYVLAVFNRVVAGSRGHKASNLRAR